MRSSSETILPTRIEAPSHESRLRSEYNLTISNTGLKVMSSNASPACQLRLKSNKLHLLNTRVHLGWFRPKLTFWAQDWTLVKIEWTWPSQHKIQLRSISTEVELFSSTRFHFDRHRPKLTFSPAEDSTLVEIDRSWASHWAQDSTSVEIDQSWHSHSAQESPSVDFDQSWPSQQHKIPLWLKLTEVDILTSRRFNFGRNRPNWPSQQNQHNNSQRTIRMTLP